MSEGEPRRGSKTKASSLTLWALALSVASGVTPQAAQAQPQPAQSQPQPAQAQPQTAQAQRQERFALTAHAALGLGGRADSHSEGFLGNINATGFEEFRDLLLYGVFGEGPLQPAPGVGLRLSFVGWRYLSVGLDFELSSLRTQHSNPARFSDAGVVVAGRLPLGVGTAGRLLTPYVAAPVGFSSMQGGRRTDERLQFVGYHVGALAGLEVELIPGLGVYLEAGLKLRRVRDAHAFAVVDNTGHVTGWRASSITTRQAVLHLGIRAAR